MLGADLCIPQSAFVAATLYCNKLHTVVPELFPLMNITDLTDESSLHSPLDAISSNMGQQFRIVAGYPGLVYNVYPASQRGLVIPAAWQQQLIRQHCSNDRSLSTELSASVTVIPWNQEVDTFRCDLATNEQFMDAIKILNEEKNQCAALTNQMSCSTQVSDSCETISQESYHTTSAEPDARLKLLSNSSPATLLCFLGVYEYLDMGTLSSDSR